MASVRHRGPVRSAEIGTRGILVMVGIALVVVLGFVGPLQAIGSPAGAATAAPSSTVWLCRPGLSNNPCAGSLTTTVVRPNGTTSVQRTVAARSPPFDCFCVYPNVSTQPTDNANLHVDPEERAVATEQASPFSQVCRVYA